MLSNQHGIYYADIIKTVKLLNQTQAYHSLVNFQIAQDTEENHASVMFCFVNFLLRTFSEAQLKKDGSKDCEGLNFVFIFTTKHIKRKITLKDVTNCQLSTLLGILIRTCVEWDAGGR